MMSRKLAPAFFLVVFLLWSSALRANDKPILIVYDLTSEFDNGKMGVWIANMLRGHARRSGLYVMVDPITFGDLIAEADVKVNFRTKPETLAKFTRDTFAGNIFIYGLVTRTPPNEEGEGYVLTFKAYELTEGGSKKLLEEKHECPRKQFCSGAVDAVLKKLAGIGDPTSEWLKLSESLKGLSTMFKAAGSVDARAEVMSTWVGELVTAERKLTSYRMAEGTHREVLDQFKKLIVDARASARALAKKEPLASGQARKILIDTERIADNIIAWLDAETVEGRWKTGKNLVLNGDFTHGQENPANWDKLKVGVSWIKKPDAKNEHDKCIRMDVSRQIARTYGMIYYSQAFTIEEGATYRFSVAAKTDKTDLKVFIKCYGEFAEKWGFGPQPREVYRAPMHIYLPEDNKTGWNTYTRDFVPYTGNRNHPRSCRVMLYAYLKAGVVFWDDVVIKKVKEAPRRQ